MDFSFQKPSLGRVPDITNTMIMGTPLLIATGAWFIALIVWMPRHSDRKDALNTEVLFWSIILTTIVFTSAYGGFGGARKDRPICKDGSGDLFGRKFRIYILPTVLVFLFLIGIA